VPDLPAEPAGEDLPALVAALRAANARLREVIEAKDAQLAAAGAALEAGQARFAALSERVAELERRLGKDSSTSSRPPSSDRPYKKKPITPPSAMPVLADAGAAFPGRPLPPWPAAVPSQPYQPPAGRGITRSASDTSTGRCPHCGHAVRRRLDATLTAHDTGGRRCPGPAQPPAEDTPPACWLPILPGLTPHGLRHGHQTWMEEAAISGLLQAERMGHKVPGMRGVYGPLPPAMRGGSTPTGPLGWRA
jgi:hypothetical protein